MSEKVFKLGIIGNPLAHSISPAMQEAALFSVNLKGNYEKFVVTKDKLPELIGYFKGDGFSGFNVTIPYKLEIIKYLDEIDETAQKIGAVNTVKITENKKLIGYNTDVFGFFTSLEFQKADNAIILGCGGAALAVVFGLEMLGCKKIRICARNIDKARDFVNSIKEKTLIELDAEKLSDLADISNTDIIINATPLGTKGENENKSPIEEEIFFNTQKSLIAYDLVYNPVETLFLKNAKQNGIKTINGLDMLVLQGAKAFEIWTGVSPSVDKMKRAAQSELL